MTRGNGGDMRGRGFTPPLLATFLAAVLPTSASARAGTTTVGDLVRVRGVRSNHLVGLGLVVGLGGTGDKSPATREAIRRFSAVCGFSAGLDVEDFTPANAALVAVTADLPPFLHVGQRIDVTVSACGDAEDLAGGTLVTTPLWAGSSGGARGETYVRAQGPVSPGGGEAGAKGAKAATVGRVRLGGIVERERAPVVEGGFTKALEAGRITLNLRKPSPQAAAAIAESIARALSKGTLLAEVRAASPGEVEIELGPEARRTPMRFLAEVLETRVEFDEPAVIVVNHRLGTVAAPGRIEIAPAAVSTGSLFVTIGGEKPGVLQPAGETCPRGERSLVSATEGVELQELVRELQRIQVSARDLIAVLDGLVKIGALRAEIVVE